jgi:magnesium chelatase accessory protein
VSRPEWSREGRDWPHRETSRFVEAGGLRWHVQVQGCGPVALLLHGTGAATHSWRGLAPLLGKEFTIVAPDLPGHGFTSAPRAEGYSLPAMAHGVAALLDALEMRPSLVVGHSAGVAIAARMALDGATRAPLVSINGALQPFPGPARTFFPTIARALVLNPFVPKLVSLQGQSRTLVARFLERSTGSRIDADGARLYQLLFACSGHCAAALAMMANWDLVALEKDLSRFADPLLLIAGDRDAAIPPSVARTVAGMVSASELVLLPQRGHLAHEEDPSGVARLISDFARRHDKVSAGGEEQQT